MKSCTAAVQSEKKCCDGDTISEKIMLSANLDGILKQMSCGHYTLRTPSVFTSTNNLEPYFNKSNDYRFLA